MIVLHGSAVAKAALLWRMLKRMPLMSQGQKLVVSIALPAALLVVILNLSVYRFSTGWTRHYWHADEQWWVWLIAIALVTAALLWLWRRR